MLVPWNAKGPRYHAQQRPYKPLGCVLPSALQGCLALTRVLEPARGASTTLFRTLQQHRVSGYCSVPFLGTAPAVP
jgi:hypothetical protein